MNLVAASFAWPFRGDWGPRWLAGVLMVALLPVAFVPLLGYAVAATRGAAVDPAVGPPRLAASIRLLTDGLCVALAVAVFTAPFALALGPLAAAIDGAQLWHVTDPALSRVYAVVAAGFALTLPWGLVMLLHMPHATVRFAISGRPLDMFDLPAALRGVAGDFATWNVAAAAIVTAWIVGLACIGLLCVGIVPGIFYAILVSAYASATLHAKVATPTPR